MQPEHVSTDERGCSRGQSEVVGMIAILGVTFVSISIILFMGMPVLDDATELTQVERTQAEFGTLHSELLASIQKPGQSGVSVDLESGGVRVDDGRNTLRAEIEYTNESGDVIADTGEIELGGLVYDAADDSSVGYQLGGVWTTYPDGGFSMRTPPEFHYSGDSLTMNLMNFTEPVSTSGTATVNYVVRSEGVDNSKFEGITNRSLDPGELEIQLRIDEDRGFDEAWEAYFENTVGGSDKAEVSGSSGEVTVTLDTGPPMFGVEYLGGRFEDAAGGPACGNPNPPLRCEPDSINVTDLRVGDESDYLTYVNATEITGGDELDLPFSASDIRDRCIDDTITGDYTGDTVTAGDYDDTGHLDDVDFDTSGGPIRYYNDDDTGQPTFENVTFDTSGSYVELHLDEDDFGLQFKNVEIEGNNPVYVFVDGGLSGPQSVDVEGGRAELLQIYSSYDPSGNPPLITGSTSEIHAALYVPGWDTRVTGGSVFRGAIISEDLTVNGEYYHDASLRRADHPNCLDPPLRNFHASERKVSLR